MRYTIYDNLTHEVIKEFNKKNDCKSWIMDGLFSCEGAERDHYVHMLSQMEQGKKTLEYWES